jgi:hypothetical protein
MSVVTAFTDYPRLASLRPRRRGAPQELVVKPPVPFGQFWVLLVGWRAFDQVPHAPALGQERGVIELREVLGVIHHFRLSVGIIGRPAASSSEGKRIEIKHAGNGA